MRKAGAFVALLVMMVLFYPQGRAEAQSRSQKPLETAARDRWVDSVYNALSPDERIGQLFMVAAYSGGKDYNQPAIEELLRNHQIGGLIFMQGDPASQALQTNKFQQMAQTPLLIAMDAEWGLGMRLTGVKDFPRQMMLGATRDSMLVYRVGMAIAKQCKRLGIHIDFAPVVDVNNNPNNPVINARSFGESKKLVSQLGLAYMQGLQDNGVMACAKHFPGHGDTDVDSHAELPVISKSTAQLDTLELYPFRKLMNAGLGSMMVAHLQVPALDMAIHTPTTLSRNTITGLLKEKMGFKGLIFTDALNMQGITKYYEPGEVDLRAFLAGNDMLLFSQNVPVAIGRIREALKADSSRIKDLEKSVKKILGVKFDMGLPHFRPVDTNHLTEDLNQYIVPLREQAALSALTLVSDRNGLLGKMTAGDARISYIGVNAAADNLLFRTLQDSIKDLMFSLLPKGSNEANVSKLIGGMEGNDVTIVAVHNLGFYPSGGDYGLDKQQMSFLQKINDAKNVLYVIMGNPYLSKYFCNPASLLVAYEDDSITEAVTAKVLLRQLSAKGRMPVTPCPGMTPVPEELPVMPEIIAGPKEVYQLEKPAFAADAGVTNPEALDKLSMFIQRSIVEGAFPGCRILAAKNGKVLYDEAFGYYAYDKTEGVELSTLYDVASMTKVLATTLAVMRLYEQGKLDLNKTLGDYLKWTRHSDKADLKISDLLMHQAGLKAWIPFYKETLDSAGHLLPKLYSREPKKEYGVQVAKNLYLRNDYPDTVWNRILTSPLDNKGRYVYSDLDYYFLAAVVGELADKPINEYVQDEFYEPMGLKSILYNPLKKFKLAAIAPTENDLSFRGQLLQGYVHDPGAALFGGVAGHAGIFASAGDAAAIFQMLLNQGSYKGKRYFKKETVRLFTAYNSRISRRGLGFDKPAPDRDDAGPAGNRVSGYAYGHQGFTGTCGWADPATGVVFIFLSNRIYPSAENNNINRQSVRTKVQDYIYEALGIPENHTRPGVYKVQTAPHK